MGNCVSLCVSFRQMAGLERVLGCAGRVLSPVTRSKGRIRPGASRTVTIASGRHPEKVIAFFDKHMKGRQYRASRARVAGPRHHGCALGEVPCYAGTSLPVRSRKASRYLSRVLRTMSGGNMGPGGFLLKRIESR